MEALPILWNRSDASLHLRRKDYSRMEAVPLLWDCPRQYGTARYGPCYPYGDASRDKFFNWGLQSRLWLSSKQRSKNILDIRASF